MHWVVKITKYNRKMGHYTEFLKKKLTVLNSLPNKIKIEIFRVFDKETTALLPLYHHYFLSYINFGNVLKCCGVELGNTKFWIVKFLILTRATNLLSL